MPSLQFRDAQIPSYQKRNGFMWLAEWLILTTDLSNKEIAKISGINRARVSPLRLQLLKNRR